MYFIIRFFSIILSAAIFTSSGTPTLFVENPAGKLDVATKLHVLDELGIEFSEETGLYIEQSIAEGKNRIADLGIDMDMSRLESYTAILTMLGTGEYDADTRSFIPLTNTVHAFDAECFDIIGAYGDFLLAISRLSNGEIQIANYHSDVDENTFESGTGTQEVVFTLNGKPYSFSAKFYYDWMDCSIIDYVNHVLEDQGIENRVWCMFDDEQGYVVFYNTPEWAQLFKARTGCPLACSAKDALKNIRW